MFHGNLTNQTVYYEAGINANGPLAFVTDIKHRDVRSEGLSYGMIIAVQLGKKGEFHAIWNWSKTYLYVSETNHPSFGFFAWQARTNGARMSQFVAPDGEEYYVTALYLAAHRWASRTGIFNYKEQADELLTRMRHRPVISGEVPWRGGSRKVQAGALFDEEQKWPVFIPAMNARALAIRRITFPHFPNSGVAGGKGEGREGGGATRGQEGVEEGCGGRGNEKSGLRAEAERKDGREEKRRGEG